jgi:hypothetical protein
MYINRSVTKAHHYQVFLLSSQPSILKNTVSEIGSVSALTELKWKTHSLLDPLETADLSDYALVFKCLVGCICFPLPFPS